jgi:hypothetical protein
MFSAMIIHDFRLPASICLIVLAFVFVTIKLFAKRAPRKKQDIAPAPDEQTAAWLMGTLELERDRIEQSAKRERAAASAERRSSKRRPDGETDSLLD